MMKRWRIALIVVLLASGSALAQESPRERIHTINDYMVYYDVGRADELARYDLVIVQPETLTDEEIADLHEGGVLTVAYLSLGEVEPYREWYTDGRYNPHWSLGQNPDWESVFVDANRPGWRSLMVSVAGEYLSRGYDGIFMDTVDTVDLYPQTIPGMIALITRLRDTYPDALLIQNRGFTIIDEVAPLLDAVMFEDLSTSYDFDSDEYLVVDNTELAQQMANLREATGLVILALDYAAPDDHETAALARQTALDYGFIPAVSVIMLDDIPDYGFPDTR